MRACVCVCVKLIITKLAKAPLSLSTDMAVEWSVLSNGILFTETILSPILQNTKQAQNVKPKQTK